MKKIYFILVCAIALLCVACKDQSNVYVYTDGDQEIKIELPEGQKEIIVAQDNPLRITFKNIDRKTATFTSNGLYIKTTEGNNVTLVNLKPDQWQLKDGTVKVTIGYMKNGTKVFKTISLPAI